MNGRLYDPILHRFLQPDNYVQDPLNSQNYNRYGYVYNNPFKFSDPSGEFIHIIIGAVVGGVINLAVKGFQGKINSWGDGFAAFGIGAVAGAVGAATGGAAFAAAGGAAGGAGGFLAGAAGGLAGSAASMPIQNIGNHFYFGDPIMSGKEYFTGIIVGGIVGGTINGAIAGYNGKNVWTGDAISSGRGMFAFNNTPKFTKTNVNYGSSVDGINRTINPETISETLENFSISSRENNLIHKATVDKYLTQMENGSFDMSAKNMAGGYRLNGGSDANITSGHHRIVAATIRGMKTGDYSILEKLIGNGRFDLTSNGLNYGYKFVKFPSVWAP